MKPELMPYKRAAAAVGRFETQRTKSIISAVFTRENLLLLPFSFLLGRASFMEGMMPFGVTIYAATLGLEFNRILVAASVLLGMVAGGAREQLYVAVMGMLLFNAFNLPFKNHNAKQIIRHSVTAFLSVLIPQLVLTYLQGFLLYDFLRSILEAFVVFASMFIFRNMLPLLRSQSIRRLTGEEAISAAIAVALALSGFGDIQLFWLNIKNIFSVLVILVMGFECGPGAGAAVGVTVGLLVSMSSSITPMIIGSYAFCGMLAGVLRMLGKVGSCLGFVMGNTVLTLYLSGSADVILYLKEILLASVLFLLIPERFLKRVVGAMGSNLEFQEEGRNYGVRIKEITLEKLNKFSRTFKELSKTFSEISETRVVTDKQDISKLFDRVADKVCKDCSLCLHCWDRNFYSTYQAMFKIIEKLDAKGWVSENDIPAGFLGKCERVGEFVKAVNSAYEVFKVDMVWKSRVGESRELISQQLGGLSDVISKLASEIDADIHFKADMEDLIYSELSRAGIKVSEAIVYENKWGKYEISIFHKGCSGKRQCISLIEKRVSELTGKKMIKDGTECCQTIKNSLCVLKLIEAETFSVSTGVAKIPKVEGGVSGDSYTFMNTGSGKFLVAVSDGMGSGQKAASQSRAAVSLMEQFMESGFDKDLTVKLINSILVLRGDDDAFATLDLTVIDLFEGEAEFVKVGAVPTYLKREDRVEVIKSVSLPAGILQEVKTDLIHKHLESGNFLIMMSDGILDAFQHLESGDQELISFIDRIQSINPQEIADSILQKAYECCGGNPADDMTVLAAKVWKRI